MPPLDSGSLWIVMHWSAAIVCLIKHRLVIYFLFAQSFLFICSINRVLLLLLYKGLFVTRRSFHTLLFKLGMCDIYTLTWGRELVPMRTVFCANILLCAIVICTVFLAAVRASHQHCAVVAYWFLMYRCQFCSHLFPYLLLPLA